MSLLNLFQRQRLRLWNHKITRERVFHSIKLPALTLNPECLYKDSELMSASMVTRNSKIEGWISPVLKHFLSLSLILLHFQKYCVLCIQLVLCVCFLSPASKWTLEDPWAFCILLVALMDKKADIHWPWVPPFFEMRKFIPCIICKEEINKCQGRVGWEMQLRQKVWLLWTQPKCVLSMAK